MRGLLAGLMFGLIAGVAISGRAEPQAGGSCTQETESAFLAKLEGRLKQHLLELGEGKCARASVYVANLSGEFSALQVWRETAGQRPALRSRWSAYTRELAAANDKAASFLEGCVGGR